MKFSGNSPRRPREPFDLALAFLLVIQSWLTVGCGEPARNAARSGPFGHLISPGTAQFFHVSSYDTTGGNRDRLEIAAGDSAVLLDVAGPGVIQRIWITVSTRDPHYLRRIALKMYWDGETTPSVLAPLGDFFGNGFDRRHYAALSMGVSSGGFYVYLPMPFRERARIVATNGTGRSVDAFYYNIDLVREVDLPSSKVATFHAWWHRDPRTTSPEPHLVLDARGRGHFVGMSLNAESHSGRLWFLEGDEIFTIDGEFRGQGTGTEDYFNGGWYFDQGPFAAPFHGLVVKDDSLARIAAYRWHVVDPVPFTESIRVELEHGHGNQEVADYATMAYWYQVEPHQPLPPLPDPDDRRVQTVKIPPGAIPAESLVVERTGARLAVDVPVPRPDRYEVIVFPLGNPAIDSARFRVGEGTPRFMSLETQDPGTALPPVILDTVTATDSVRIEVRGEARVEIAAALVQPIRRWAREWNVVGPFPNPQRLGSEASPAIDSIYGPERDPSLGGSYAGVEGRQVRWQRVLADADGQVRLNPHFAPNDWVAAYAQAFLYSPDEREATLLLGADDAHVIWVNGERVSERQGRHISEPDDVEVPIQLRAGWNRVMLKVADLDGGWAFQARVADPGGRLRWAARP